jgi:acyl-CoA synthetase (AMP-forming)/AMP-acid ligase II
MDKIWLKLPRGRAARRGPDQYRSAAHLLEEAMRKHAASPSVCMERWMSYGELDRHSAALGAWLQGLGWSRRARGHHAAQRAAVRRDHGRRAARGYTCVNVNPLYTARELEHQLKDSGATAIVILENFAHTLAEVVEHTNVKHVVMASMGDLLGFWYGRWITFAVRHLAKMVPAYELPLTGGRQVTSFRRRWRWARAAAAQPGHHDSIAFLQYTGGTTGLSKARC